MSADGRFVACEACQTTNFGAPMSAPGVILRYDLQTGSTDIVNTNAIAVGYGSEQSFRGFDMTPDGQFIALVAGWGRCVGGQHRRGSLERPNRRNHGTASVDINNSPVTNGISDQPALDSSGRYVAFRSDATNLTTNSVVGGFHLYVRDLQAGVTTLADADTNGAGLTGNLSPLWSLSADGSVIAFAAWGRGAGAERQQPRLRRFCARPDEQIHGVDFGARIGSPRWPPTDLTPSPIFRSVQMANSWRSPARQTIWRPALPMAARRSSSAIWRGINDIGQCGYQRRPARQRRFHERIHQRRWPVRRVRQQRLQPGGGRYQQRHRCICARPAIGDHHPGQRQYDGTGPGDGASYAPR